MPQDLQDFPAGYKFDNTFRTMYEKKSLRVPYSYLSETPYPARLGTIVIYLLDVTQTGCYENDVGSTT